MKRRTAAEREVAAEVEAKMVKAIYTGIEETTEDWRRDHLGASLIGHKCDRYLWLNFRWAANPNHDGRQLRLFRRGQLEEAAITHDLRVAGIQVTEKDPGTDDQIRVKWGHIGGSVDAVAQMVPGLDDTEWVLVEMKTYSAKSFGYLKGRRVRASKKEHWAQMQVYMHGLEGVEHALYIAVHKDTDEVYVELVDYDEAAAKDLLARGQQIVEATVPPDKLDRDQIPCVYTSKDGTRWPCDYFDLCHGNAMPERNCRTCVESTPDIEGDQPVWSCCAGKKPVPISSEDQRVGCDQQCSIPPIVNADIHKVDGRTITYQFAGGELKKEVDDGRP